MFGSNSPRISPFLARALNNVILRRQARNPPPDAKAPIPDRPASCRLAAAGPNNVTLRRQVRSPSPDAEAPIPDRPASCRLAAAGASVYLRLRRPNSTLPIMIRCLHRHVPISHQRPTDQSCPVTCAVNLKADAKGGMSVLSLTGSGSNCGGAAMLAPAYSACSSTRIAGQCVRTVRSLTLARAATSRCVIRSPACRSSARAVVIFLRSPSFRCTALRPRPATGVPWCPVRD
jgi:hypothetical protein